MSDRKFELSRRNALIGLGTVGAASAGAGIGTSAYFSDQEVFDGNTIQAGEFGLTVEQQVHDIDQDGIGPDEENFDAGIGDNGIWIQDSITIEDAKPGDEYEFCWEITVEENPGYVALAACYDDWTGVEADNVALDDLWDIDDESNLSTIGDETLVDDVTLENGESASYSYGTVGELLSDLQSGALLDDDGTPVEFAPGETWTLCVDLSIPTEVGNELQGALLEWDLAFYAEQARHNDGGGVADRAADSIVCEVDREPECLECNAPNVDTDDFDVTIEDIDDSGFPTIESTVRVDTDIGRDGDLTEGEFQVCEETVDGLGDGFCGQTIDTLTFAGEDEGESADVMIAFDTSGSMEFEAGKFENAKDGGTTLVDNLGPGVNVGLVEFGGSAQIVEFGGSEMTLGTDQATIRDAIDDLEAGGTTPMADAIDISQGELDDKADQNTPDFMIVLANGIPDQTQATYDAADTAKAAGTTIITIAYGDDADEGVMLEISSPPKNGDDPNAIQDEDENAFVGGLDDIEGIGEDIGQIISGTYNVTYETANFATDGTDRNVVVYVDDPDEGDADEIGSYTAPG